MSPLSHFASSIAIENPLVFSLDPKLKKTGGERAFSSSRGKRPRGVKRRTGCCLEIGQAYVSLTHPHSACCQCAPEVSLFTRSFDATAENHWSCPELEEFLAWSPKSALKERIYLEENPEKSEVTQDTDTQSLIGSPSPRIAPHIIGAEDDDFGTEHEQINGQCSCFQSIELLKSRPAHLAVFLHHVVSQFDPATLVMCFDCSASSEFLH